VLNLTVSEVIYGPLFDGRAERAIEDACHEVEERTAQYGAWLIRNRMDQTFRTQTPFYRLQNKARRDGAHWKISDAGVIYGPWLEGIGSRNATTRFKGYFNYRRSVQEIQQRMSQIAAENVYTRLRAVGA
jgi:hypothetical protein